MLAWESEVHTDSLFDKDRAVYMESLKGSVHFSEQIFSMGRLVGDVAEIKKC